jgi:hypothetical protein
MHGILHLRYKSYCYSYVARVNTKRDWLICGHAPFGKCNVSQRKYTTGNKIYIRY